MVFFFTFIFKGHLWVLEREREGDSQIAVMSSWKKREEMLENEEVAVAGGAVEVRWRMNESNQRVVSSFHLGSATCKHRQRMQITAWHKTFWSYFMEKNKLFYSFFVLFFQNNQKKGGPLLDCGEV